MQEVYLSILRILRSDSPPNPLPSMGLERSLLAARDPRRPEPEGMGGVVTSEITLRCACLRCLVALQLSIKNQADPPALEHHT